MENAPKIRNNLTDHHAAVKLWTWLLVKFVVTSRPTGLDEALCLDCNAGQPIVRQISGHWALARTQPSYFPGKLFILTFLHLESFKEGGNDIFIT